MNDEYFCCGLHHSSYCPECLGKLCMNRLIYSLNSQGGNDETIAKVNIERIDKNERRVNTQERCP